MLDVHIIISPETRHDWIAHCLWSIQEARNNAGFAVDVHIAPYHAGHIGKSRGEGYRMGVQPYVTCVDDDDWLQPNAFMVLAKAMADNPAAIYTGETQWINGKPVYSRLRQHMRVFRRDVTQSFNFDAWPALDSTAIIAHADTFNQSINLPHRVYNYRVRPESSAKRIAYGTPNLLQTAVSLGNVHEIPA